jgi:hypothetical protein
VNGGTGKVVGSGWQQFNGQYGNTLWAFSGGNGIIYAIHKDGTLWWFRHLGAADGTVNWLGGKQIGAGFGSATEAFGAGDGVIYIAHSDGSLWRYRELDPEDGSANWVNGNGTEVAAPGSGWDPFTLDYAFAGGNGDIYVVHFDGTLLLLHDAGVRTDTENWANGGNGIAIGSGFSGGARAFSAGDGTVYLISTTGTLLRFDYLGSGTWANGGTGVPIGSGWDSAQFAFADVTACSLVADHAATQIGNGPCPGGQAYGVNGYNSCSGEPWCADFAGSMWQGSYFNVNGLSDGASSFYDYGARNGTLHAGAGYRPHLGDAAVYDMDTSSDYAQHVGLVTAVYADGSVQITNGNFGNAVENDQIPSSQVAPGSYQANEGYTVSAYISPLA